MFKILKQKIKDAELEEISLFGFVGSIIVLVLALSTLIMATALKPSSQKINKTIIDSNVPALVVTK